LLPIGFVIRRLASALAFAIAAAGGAQAQPPEQARAAEALAPFKRDLQAALREGLGQGPVAAIDACRLRAPQIAEERSQGGVRVGRASHRLRNPENVPPSWVAPLLEAALAAPSARGPRLVALDAGRSGYVEPIFVQPLCLTCHGASLSPDVSARIQERYPQDRAVGFQAGDFRGLFWIELPPAAPRSDRAP